jgi:predicted MPP superfamily phosphohydrolase
MNSVLLKENFTTNLYLMREAMPPEGLALLSDLHAEHGLDRPLQAIRSIAKKNPEVKALALAGDVGNWSVEGSRDSSRESFTELLRKTSEEGLYEKILVVPGNHDYYFCHATWPLEPGEDPSCFFLSGG